MAWPVVTTELAQRLTQAEAAYMSALVAGLRRRFGAESGIEAKRFGQALGLIYPSNSNPLLNRVIGFTPGDLEHLTAILHWYRERGVQVRFEIIPPLSTGKLLRELTAWGLSQTAFYTVLYGVPQADTPVAPPDIQITELSSDTDFAAFASVFTQTYAIDENLKDAVRESVLAQYRQPDFRCYLARLGGEAAAIGAMHLQNGVASLLSGATAPAFRQRGCQTALLHRRIADAARAGCDLVVSFTEVGSVSQHNMERVGLRIAYTKAEWTLSEL